MPSQSAETHTPVCSTLTSADCQQLCCTKGQQEVRTENLAESHICSSAGPAPVPGPAPPAIIELLVYAAVTDSITGLQADPLKPSVLGGTRFLWPTCHMTINRPANVADRHQNS